MIDRRRGVLGAPARCTNIAGYRTQVSAAQVALDGVIEEQDIGQRTTLDILNAQSQLISAEMLMVGAERDLVISSYALLAALGKLTSDYEF